MKLRNGPAWQSRLALAPMTNQQSNDDGTLHEDELRWLRRRAEGGFSMVMTCAAHVAPEGQGFPGQLGVWHDRFVPGLTRLADDLRANGAVSCVQLHHGGIRADPGVSGIPAVAPWDDPERGVKALTKAEIAGVVGNFARAARRAQEAGFDGVEIHGAHGYILAQFLNAAKNTRTDGYGGSLTDRSRIFFDVLEAVRDATEPGFQVGIRLSPQRWGIVLDESLIVAERILASGLVDYLDMSLWDVRSQPEDAHYGGRTFFELFAALPRHGTRLGVAGKITSAEAVQWCLDEGADFVLVGTGAILQHDFAKRVLEDPTFVSVDQPVSRMHLESQDVGSRFLNYLSTNWDDFVR
jgi:2,4-dienoyl-CoA reductase-like NADH-dependent reductase (Old Yellow Enzyme family)